MTSTQNPKEDAVRAWVADLIECESVPNADRGVSKNLQTFQNVINGWSLTPGDKRPTPLFAAGCGGGGEGEEEDCISDGFHFGRRN